MSEIKHCTSLLIILIRFVAINANNCNSNDSQVEIKFNPEFAEKILEYEEKHIQVYLHSKSSLPYEQFVFEFLTEQSGDQVIEFTNGKSWTVQNEEIANGTKITFTLKANIIGRTGLKWRLSANKTVISDGVLTASVIAAKRTMLSIFTIVITIMVTINNINMGCHLELDVIRNVMKKPYALVIGICCQFLLMPLGSYLYGTIYFGENASLRLGLLVLGCSPGGAGSNFWTLLLDGDLNLSVTMTLVSTIAALGLMPLWIFLLGNQITKSANLRVPHSNLMYSLLGMTLPLAIGVIIQKYRPNWSQFAKKIIRPFTVVLITFMVTAGVYVNWYIFRLMTWYIIAAGMSVAWSGYIFGALSAYIARLPRTQIIAVSIETALQNHGMAFVVLRLSFPQPESDLAAVPLIGQVMTTTPPLWTVYFVYLIIRKIRIRYANMSKKQAYKTDDENEANNEMLTSV